MPSSAASRSGQGDSQHDVKITLTGVTGESQRRGHENDIDVIKWNWGASTLRSHSKERVSLQVKDFTFTKMIDVTTPLLFTLMQQNKVVNEVNISIYKAGGAAAVCFYKLMFKEVLVTNIDAGEIDDNGHFIETITVNFAEVQMEGTSQGGKGLKDRTTTFQFRISENR